jgi:hypothetical protein
MASTEAKTDDPRPAVLGDLRMKQNPMIVDPVGPITGGAGSVHTRETAEKRTSIVAHPYLRLWCGTWNVGTACLLDCGQFVGCRPSMHAV